MANEHWYSDGPYGHYRRDLDNRLLDSPSSGCHHHRMRMEFLMRDEYDFSKAKPSLYAYPTILKLKQPDLVVGFKLDYTGVVLITYWDSSGNYEYADSASISTDTFMGLTKKSISTMAKKIKADAKSIGTMRKSILKTMGNLK